MIKKKLHIFKICQSTYLKLKVLSSNYTGYFQLFITFTCKQITDGFHALTVTFMGGTGTDIASLNSLVKRTSGIPIQYSLSIATIQCLNRRRKKKEIYLFITAEYVYTLFACNAEHVFIYTFYF